jgi:hypothetical protein
MSTGAANENTTPPTAQPFTQVYKVVNRPVGRYDVIPVALDFTTITCFGFSPNITAIGGSLTTDATTTPQTTTALIMWRNNIAAATNDLRAVWSRLDLGVPGYVTAIKFVGYAWYIATWNPYANFDNVQQTYEGASSLFFASINFNAVSFLDSWNASSGVVNVSQEITSIDATTMPPGTCGEGFEPDPNNPNMCVKVCPTGYSPFGTLCVQTCNPPFLETAIPNQCVPDSLPAKTISPTASGLPPETLPLQQGPPKGQVGESVSWVSLLSVSLISILVIMVLLGLLFRSRN